MKAVILILFGISGIALSTGSRSPAPPTQSCRTNADTAGNIIKTIQATIATTDSGLLGGMGLLPTAGSQVLLVTNDSTCAMAVAAYNASLPTDSTTTVTSVFVLKAGPSRFVVFAPEYGSGEFIDLLIFDQSFAFKGQLEG